MRHRRIVRLVALLVPSLLFLANCGGGGTEAPGEVTRIRVGTPTLSLGNTWHLYLADKLGYFADENLEVEFIPVGTSAASGQQLASGDIEIAGPGLGDAVRFIQLGVPVRIVGTFLANSAYRVMAQKNISSWEDIRGGALISVTATTDVTRAFVDYLAAKHGLTPGEDYDIIAQGGSSNRLAALVNGAVAAAILPQPVDLVAEREGFTELSRAWQELPFRFPLAVWVVNQEWAAENSEALTGFLRAVVRAGKDFNDPARRGEVIALAQDTEYYETPASSEDATQFYDVFIEAEVISTDGRVTVEEVDGVTGILLDVGILDPPIPPYSQIVDNTYVDAAQSS